MQTKIIICFTCLLLFCKPLNSRTYALKHPYYVGICEIVIPTQKGNAEVVFKLFTDDVQKALHQEGFGNILLEKQGKEQDKALTAYIQKYVSLQLNFLPLALEYVGYEVKEEAVWIYYQAAVGSAKAQELRVKNRLLTQTCQGQINIIHLSYGNYRESYKLSADESEHLFTLPN